MASRKRYTLLVVQGSFEKRIPILNRNPEDVKNHLRISEYNHLPTIDLHTMNYENEQELLKAHRNELKLAGININKKVYVKIAYNANKKRYVIDPVYQDKIFLKKFALGTETNIDEEKIKEFIAAFKSIMGNGQFFRYAQDNKLLDQRMFDLIRTVIKTNDSFVEKLIETELQRYKVIRRILLNLEPYQKSSGQQLFDYEKEASEYKEKTQISIFDLMKEEPVKRIDKDDNGGGKKLTKK